jgi:hypothetical protein
MAHEERRAAAPKASSARDTMAVGFEVVFMAMNGVRCCFTQHDAGRFIEELQGGRQTNDITDHGLT